MIYVLLFYFYLIQNYFIDYRGEISELKLNNVRSVEIFSVCISLEVCA